jgi:hypothetical protein
MEELTATKSVMIEMTKMGMDALQDVESKSDGGVIVPRIARGTSVRCGMSVSADRPCAQHYQNAETGRGNLPMRNVTMETSLVAMDATKIAK